MQAKDAIDFHAAQGQAVREYATDSGPAYLQSIQSHKQVQATDGAMNVILASHHIDAAHLRADAFDAFFQARSRALLSIVERAMGKVAQAATGEAAPFPEEEAEESAEAVAMAKREPFPLHPIH